MGAATVPRSATRVRAFAGACLRGFDRRDGNGELSAMLLVASAGLAWNCARLYAPRSLTGALFFLGPCLGLGVALTTLSFDADSLGTFAFLSLVNAVLGVVAVAGVARYTPALPDSTAGVVVGFNVALVAVLGAVLFDPRERGERLPRPPVRRSDLLFAGTCLAVLAAATLAFRTKATTGDRLPPLLAFLWVPATFVVLFVRSPDDETRQTLFLGTAGVVMTWSHALSSNGLMAVDGLSTVRLARSILSDVDVTLVGARLSENLTVSVLFPGLVRLSTWTPFGIGKYVVPAVAGLTLVGIYRVTREWLDPRTAFAATFLFCFQWPFFAELPTNYRSSMAFPALVAVYLAVRAESTTARYGLAVAYVAGTVLLHDTVGIFLLGALGMAAAIALATRRLRPDVLSSRHALALVALANAGVLLFYFVYSQGETLTRFVLHGVFLAISVLSGSDLQGGSGRTVETTVGSLGASIVDLLQQATIVVEIGLMGLGTALLIAGWVRGPRLTDRLPWHDGDRFVEVLVVANAAWFGALVVQPVLGVTRVFLYAAPLMLGIFAFAIRQTDALPALRRRVGSPSDGGATETTAALDPFGSRRRSGAVLVAFLVVAFLVNSGIGAMAVGGTTSVKAFGDTDRVDFKHYSQQDVAGNEWVTAHSPDDVTLYIEAMSFPLFEDDPEVPYSRLIRLHEGDRLRPTLEDGCLFVRGVSAETGELVVRLDDRGTTAPRPYSLDVLDEFDTVYTAGETRVVC